MPSLASPLNTTAMKEKHHNISDEMLAAFLDGNLSADETMQVVSAIGSEKEVAEILSLSDAIDNLAQSDDRYIIPMGALAAANPENLCSFDCEVFILQHLDYDIDHWSLLETAKANNWLREKGTPLHHVGRLLELKGLHVDRKYDATISDLATALANGKQIIAIIDNNMLNQQESVDQTPRYHAIYVTGVEEDGSISYLNLETLLEEEIGKAAFEKAWKRSSNFMMTTSRYSTEYNPQPIDVEHIDLDASLEELTEAIAENAHDIWARARMDEGWTYGVVRDDAKKHHPDLVPYAQLPESEKEYDRLMAMNTLRLVRRLGYDFIKPE